ncbi:MAG: hypothetical protein ACRC10_03365 [Thermoguttaceae bacterium]
MIQRCSSKLAIALLVFAVCCSLLGCRSNGGPWYKPSSYAFNNPFNKNKAGLYDEESRFADNTPASLPREGMRPNVSTPPGGYTEQRPSQYAASSGVPNTGVPSAVGMSNTQVTTPQVAYNGVPNQSYPGQNTPYNAQQQPNYQQQQPAYQPQSYPQSGTQPYQQGGQPVQQPTQDTTSYSQYPPGSYQGTTAQQGHAAQPEYRPGNYSY